MSLSVAVTQVRGRPKQACKAEKSLFPTVAENNTNPTLSCHFGILIPVPSFLLGWQSFFAQAVRIRKKPGERSRHHAARKTLSLVRAALALLHTCDRTCCSAPHTSTRDAATEGQRAVDEKFIAPQTVLKLYARHD